jgi:hypothetical protein
MIFDNRILNGGASPRLSRHHVRRLVNPGEDGGRGIEVNEPMPAATAEVKLDLEGTHH